jgi:peptidoglycan hydrolase-like protein with peptidoglycan-binding domain
MTPRNVLYIVLATVAGTAFGAWYVGSQIKSPAEVAARTAPPTPSPILVPIEKRVLSTDVVTRGTVRFGLPQPLSIVPSTLKATPGLIANLPPRNHQLKEGDVILTASGRPVFLLQGKSPVFRDLTPGVTGDDVRQLEQALRRLGLKPGKIDGVYDQSTGVAVKRWYEREGWLPFVPTLKQTEAVRALERNWADARRARLGAESVLATTKETVEAARAAADQAIKAAKLARATGGAGGYGQRHPISIVPSTFKASPGLIATLPLRDQELKEGDVILTASGRPVFLLQGKSPIFRDLTPGLSGGDVRQFEQALKRLGFDPGEIDGVYDENTGDAVKRWYEREGWEPFAPTFKQTQALQALERNWADARRARLGAESVLATSKKTVESARAAADQAIKAAQLGRAKYASEKRLLQDAKENAESLSVENERAKAELAESTAEAQVAAQLAELARISLDPRQPESARALAKSKLELAKRARASARLQGRLAIQAAEKDIALARERISLADAAIEAARQEGKRSIQAAQEAFNLAKFDLKLARERVSRAAAEYKRAQAKLGILVPADEIVFVPSTKVRIEDVTTGVGKEATGIIMTVTNGQPVTASALPRFARERAELADAAVEAAQLEGRRSIQAAQEAFNLAKFDLELANDRAKRAEVQYKLAKQKLGILVPADEIVFIPSPPVRVEDITTAVGKQAAGTVMTVTDNRLAVDSALPLDVATLVKPGTAVAIDEQTLGKKAKGVVSYVANAPGTRGVDGYHFYFETRVEDADAQLKGVSVRLTIPIESTADKVLAVPVSAVSLAADGSSRVQVKNSKTGTLEYVAVKPGLAAGGLVEIKPIGRKLLPGQLIVVGYKNPKSGF